MNEMFGELRQKIETLMAAYEAVKFENAALKAELRTVKDENEACRRQNTELEKEIDNLKLRQAFMGAADGNELAKQRIEKMIREIDKCIALMEK